jgi:ATP-binding cassette subfamily C (CFTR/MRP) protein 5
MSVLMKGEVAPALAGLALSYAAHISGIFQYTIRLMSETETRFISVERIQAAAEGLEVEGVNSKFIPPADWLSKGTIRFNNVCLRYRPHLPDVLHSLSFSVKHGEKLGRYSCL